MLASFGFFSCFLPSEYTTHIYMKSWPLPLWSLEKESYLKKNFARWSWVQSDRSRPRGEKSFWESCKVSLAWIKRESDSLRLRKTFWSSSFLQTGNWWRKRLINQWWCILQWPLHIRPKKRANIPENGASSQGKQWTGKFLLRNRTWA